MKVNLISLGCSKNLVDAEVMLGLLNRAGFSITDELDEADIVIVNTCAFIKDAKEEAIAVILEILALKKKGKFKKVIVTGCLPQRYQKELPGLLQEVDGFLGPGDLDKIVALLRSILKDSRQNFFSGKKHFLYKHHTPRINLTPRHYAYVKIADGCNNCCSYCVIPQIRGKYQSRPMESIVREARLLADKGVKEINLISQDSSFYGTDIYRRRSLDILLKKLTGIKQLHWIRVLYTHPLHIDRSLLEVIAAEPKICKYIDLPIQHINDKILKLMCRKVNKHDIKNLIDMIREIIPEAALRTTLIVGFPQETPRRFKELYEFVRKTGFERLGVFKYSPEENTAALKLKQRIPERVKERRVKDIMLLQQKIVERRHRAMVGSKAEVLIDKVLDKNTACGRTQFDAPEVDGLVYVSGRGIKQGDLVNVMISENLHYDLMGRKI